MNDKRKSNLGPAQLDRLLGQITDRTNGSSDENEAIRTQIHGWLHSSLDERSTLPDSLKEALRVFDKTIIEKSLIDLLLNEDNPSTVLYTLAYCAQEYSLNVTKPLEDALAHILYYTALASLLVFHHQESAEHSLESLVELFTDLKVKPWLPSEIKHHIDRACQICQKKQIQNGDKMDQDHTISTHAQVSLARWVESVGARIGCYKLLRVLGEGGMGMVYLAEQEQLIRRRVALKIIKPGMDSKRVLARFEAERQALALLDHPNIAQVYDAGTADSGRPYFVMEYVKGTPMTEFCDRHTLSIEDRLRLFQQVCNAFQHAHQKGIIHRDIKPSNILVSSENDQIVPKIIDFGVAKAVSQPLTERTLITEESQLLGTPEYMSPEQVELVNEDIDTRSDIYSLGVLLYELLTGVLPFDSETLREGGVENIRKVIRETDPKTPSTQLMRLGEQANDIAQNRRTQIGTLAKCLHRELEWIPLKAMRKERSERYRSASELADDIQNYLKGNPLTAGPPGPAYYLKKFVRRKRTLLAGIAAVLVVFAGGLIASSIFAIQKVRARAEAQAIGNFLTAVVIPAANPHITLNESILSVLDAISDELKDTFESTPLVEAEMYNQLGKAYWRFDQLDRAEEHIKRALQIEEIPKNKVEAMKNLGHVYMGKGRLDEAESQCRKALEWGLRLLGTEHMITLWSMNCLALVYRAQKRYEQAESLFLEMIEISRRVFGETHQTSLVSTGNLAIVYAEQGRYEEAERLLLRLQELQPDIVHYENPEMTGFMQWLASIYAKQGRFEEAEPIFLRVLENRRLRRGETHRKTLETFETVAKFYIDQQRYEKSEPLMTRAVWGRRLTLGDEHPDTLDSWHNLINLYDAWNKPEKANQWRGKMEQIEDFGK